MIRLQFSVRLSPIESVPCSLSLQNTVQAPEETPILRQKLCHTFWVLRSLHMGHMIDEFPGEGWVRLHGKASAQVKLLPQTLTLGMRQRGTFI